MIIDAIEFILDLPLEVGEPRLVLLVARYLGCQIGQLRLQRSYVSPEFLLWLGVTTQGDALAHNVEAFCFDFLDKFDYLLESVRSDGPVFFEVRVDGFVAIGQVFDVSPTAVDLSPPDLVHRVLVVRKVIVVDFLMVT